ncbi:hypothetical protein ACLB2K_063764 [Fragaria x ananassa]
MGIRSKLWLVENKRTKKTIMPQAGYTNHPQKKAKVFQWLHNIKYPHGPYLQSYVVDTLVALSKLFKRICAKELKKSDVRSLEEDIILSNAEIKVAHKSVLQHYDEAERYFKSHLERHDGNEVIHKRVFPNYFPIWMMHILQHFPDSYDPELHLLAGEPHSHIVCAGYFVNVVKFVTSEQDEGHAT